MTPADPDATPLVSTGTLPHQEDVRRIVDEALSAHDRIDILANNAGRGHFRPRRSSVSSVVFLGIASS